MRPPIESFGLDWHRSYGPLGRRGWGVTINGSVAGPQFNRNIFLALWRAWLDYRTWDA